LTVDIVINTMKDQAVKFLSLLSIFLNRIHFSLVHISTLFHPTVVTFIKIGTADVILYLRM